MKNIKSVAEFNKPEIKVVYEVAYAITLGIYDAANSKYYPDNTKKNNCSVTSIATLVSRRAGGVKVTFTAKVSAAKATTAKAESKAITENPAKMVTSVAAAKAAIVKDPKIMAELKAQGVTVADIGKVKAPTKDDLEFAGYDKKVCLVTRF